jgi:hypothetical protein
MNFSRYRGPLAVAIRRMFQGGMVDPWPDEINAAVREPDAHPVCLRCLRPQEGHYWFCRDCGFPSGEYMTVMPFLQVFPLGHMLQRGVVGEPERRKWVTAGYVAVSLCEYTVFAPVYWYWMYRKATGRPICQEWRPEWGETEDAQPGATDNPGHEHLNLKGPLQSEGTQPGV